MITVYLEGYVDTVKPEFQHVIEATAQKGGYTVNRLMIDGNAFVPTPQKAVK